MDDDVFEHDDATPGGATLDRGALHPPNRLPLLRRSPCFECGRSDVRTKLHVWHPADGCPTAALRTFHAALTDLRRTLEPAGFLVLPDHSRLYELEVYESSPGTEESSSLRNWLRANRCASDACATNEEGETQEWLRSILAARDVRDPSGNRGGFDGFPLPQRSPCPACGTEDLVAEFIRVQWPSEVSWPDDDEALAMAAFSPAYDDFVAALSTGDRPLFLVTLDDSLTGSPYAERSPSGWLDDPDLWERDFFCVNAECPGAARFGETVQDFLDHVGGVMDLDP